MNIMLNTKIPRRKLVLEWWSKGGGGRQKPQWREVRRSQGRGSQKEEFKLSPEGWDLGQSISEGKTRECKISSQVRYTLVDMDRKKDPEDFPGGPVVKNPPANAGDPGSIPGLGRFHKLQATKPKCPKVPLCNKGSHHNEKHTHHS